MMDKLKEECGVFGIFDHEEAARLTYLGLYALQHRGQESAGIVSSDGERLHQRARHGVCQRDIQAGQLGALAGPSRPSATCAIRPPAASPLLEAQPFLVDGHRGQIALCHNGNLPYATRCAHELELDGAIFSSTSDTEVVLHKHSPLARQRSRRRDRRNLERDRRRVFDALSDAKTA